ncbi:MAG: hypothetical protein AAF191_01600 [Verrucomicrobiota bacterium]
MSGSVREDGSKRLGIGLTNRWVPEKSDHGRLVHSAFWTPTERLTIGFDYRPLSREVAPSASFQLLQESFKLPQVTIGTSADGFAGISSQEYHIIAGKNVSPYATWGISPWAGAMYIPGIDDVRVIGGLHLSKGRLTTMGMYSGEKTHLVTTWKLTDTVSTGHVWWGLEMHGLTVNFHF